MDTTALIVWQSFLQTTPADRQASLLSCVSPELAAALKARTAPPELCQQESLPAEEELFNIHYSWLSPVLRALPENEIRLFLACLTPEQMKGLKQALLLSNMLPTLSEVGKGYLQKTLFTMMRGEEVIPAAYLPADPLNRLLELNYQELTSLIDLLAMHDLSIEIRHIIETSKLKEIQQLLSKAQTTFLKTLLHKKEPVAFKKMGLTVWKGDKESLRSMLLQRGINRIAKSLYGKDPSLLWYTAHRLDAEKGQLLIKLCTALDHPRASLLLSEQVVELVHSLKNSNPPHNA